MYNALLCLIVSSVNWLDKKPIYDEPLANVRSVDTSFTADTSTYLGSRVIYYNGSIGANIPVVTYDTGTVLYQADLEGGTWVTLGYSDGVFPLLTQDFLLSLPLSFRYKNWSGKISYTHISSHLGDGFEGMIEDHLSEAQRAKLWKQESILNANITLVEPFNYSRDVINTALSYEFDLRGLEFRTYGQFGYANRMYPDTLNRWFVGGGLEAKYPGFNNTWEPYAAEDTTWNGDVDYWDVSGQLGFILLSSADQLFECRVAMTGYRGSDRRGQLLGRRLDQLGIGFFIR